MASLSERYQSTVDTDGERVKSHAAHRAALLFNDSAEAYPGSVAMQAIHVSIAYREGPQDVSLSDMSKWLLADETKVGNIITLARIKHAERKAQTYPGWEDDTTYIIRSVFELAEVLLRVEPQVLRGYYRFHPDIISDRRRTRDTQNENGKEIRMRTALRRLAGSPTA